MKQYALLDWANNRLTDKKGHELTFNSFEDGWNYIYLNYQEEDFEELYVEELNNEN